jgi:hypothetical protein
MGGTRTRTSFEEALHKSEEERFEYQVHVEGLIQVIALLELLYARFEDMTNEKRTLFKPKLDPGGAKQVDASPNYSRRSVGGPRGTPSTSGVSECCDSRSAMVFETERRGMAAGPARVEPNLEGSGMSPDTAEKLNGMLVQMIICIALFIWVESNYLAFCLLSLPSRPTRPTLSIHFGSYLAPIF